MQKIGLAKCLNKNMIYFKNVSKNEVIYINEPDLSTISSNIINTSILSSEFINNINAIRLFIKITIKIIYSKSLDTSLYVHEEEIFTTEYIYIPNTIDGNLSSQSFIKNKIKPEVFIENVNVKNVKNNKIIINFHLLLNLKIKPSFYFSYIMNNGLFENIFLSHADGENLLQKTFTSEDEYRDIQYQPNGQSIAAISQSPYESSLCLFDINSRNKYECNFINIYGSVNSFAFMNANKIVLSIKKNNDDYLYTANLNSKEVKLINNSIINKVYENLRFDKNLNMLYFMSFINNTKCLCSFDKSYNFEIVFNKVDVDDYVVSHNGENIILKSHKENKDQLHIFHVLHRFVEFINLNFAYDKILKMNFYPKSQEQILILYTYDELEYFALYNFKNFQLKVLFSNENIMDFVIDVNTNDIFIVAKFNNYSQIIKINNKNTQFLFKIPSMVKEICIK